jgi:hypothetical protein
MRPGAGLCTGGASQWVPSLVNPFAREDARSFLASSCRAELQRQFDGYGDQRSQQRLQQSDCAFLMRPSEQTDLGSDRDGPDLSHAEAAAPASAPFIDFLGVGVV